MDRELLGLDWIGTGVEKRAGGAACFPPCSGCVDWLLNSVRSSAEKFDGRLID